MSTDTHAIEAVKRGDKEQFSGIIDRYQRMVYGIAWSRLGDADLCEDAVQETFVKAFRYLGALRNPEKFQAWLARIARNVSTSILRRHKRELDKRERWRVLQPEADDTGDAVDEEPLSETLRVTLVELPQEHRECLILFYIEGKSVKETAQILSVSEGTIKTRLHRARKVLRGRLEEKLEESLSNLSGQKGMTGKVMALLPPAPLAITGLGSGSLLGKGATGFLKSFVLSPALFVMLVFDIVLMGLFYRWLGKLESDNLAPSTMREARLKIIRNNVIVLVIVSLSVITFSRYLFLNFGVTLVFQLMSPMCALGVYTTMKALRVNRTPYTYGAVIANVFFLVISFLIGFLGVPYYYFFVGMVPLNVVLYYTNKSRPIRHDYNLFLRAAQGTLGKENNAIDLESETISYSEMYWFMRFLGEHFLIIDYRFNDNGIVVSLSPLKVRIGQYFGIPQKAGSWVRIYWNGQCEAELGLRDARDIQKATGFTQVDHKDLETKVSDAVKMSLSDFLSGDQQKALQSLQAEGDESVFLTAPGNSREHRVRGALAVFASMLILMFILTFVFSYAVEHANQTGEIPFMGMPIHEYNPQPVIVGPQDFDEGEPRIQPPILGDDDMPRPEINSATREQEVKESAGTL